LTACVRECQVPRKDETGYKPGRTPRGYRVSGTHTSNLPWLPRGPARTLHTNPNTRDPSDVSEMHDTPGGGPADASLLAQQCPMELSGTHGDAHLRYGAAHGAATSHTQPLAPSDPNPQPHMPIVMSYPLARAAERAPSSPLRGLRLHISELPRSQDIPPFSLPAHPS
jgi:hypothetical protein